MQHLASGPVDLKICDNKQSNQSSTILPPAFEFAVREKALVKFRWKLWRHFHRKDISNSCDVVSPSSHPMKHSDWAREIFRWEQKVLIIRFKLLESQLVKQQRSPAISITLVGKVEEAMKLSRDEVLGRMNKSFHLGYKKAHAFSWIYSKAVQMFSYPEMIPFP